MTANRWTWDEAKSRSNKLKHGLTFETAVLVFEDPVHQTYADPYVLEDRWQTFGFIQQILIVVVHTDPVEDEDGQMLAEGRIISARKATSHERTKFEESTYG
jgi:uncharacterized protein